MQLNKILKYLLYCSLLTMLVTGGLWLILDNFFQQKTIVGLQKNPLQPILLTIHGVFSYLFTGIFGYIISDHVAKALSAKRYRISGYSLIASISISILSGCCFLFLSLEDFHSIVTWVHVLSALLILGSLVVHIRINTRR